MKKYQVVSGSTLILRTDNFEEAYDKLKSSIEKFRGSDWFETAYKETRIEKLAKDKPCYLPI